MADHLIRKAGENTWYVRLAVPADVRAALGGKTVLTRSLKTGLRGVAMVRRLAVLDEWKAVIDSARTGVPLAEGWRDDLVSMVSAVDEMIQGQKRTLIGEELPPVTISPETRAILLANPKGTAAFKSWVKDGLGGGIESGMAMYEQLQEALKTLIPNALAGSQNIPVSQRQELAELLANPAAHKQASPITTARLKAFREFREGRGGAPKHIDQQVRRMEDLSQFLKDKSLPLEFDSIDAWIKSLNRAPATLSQHLMSGTAFWTWATKYDAGWRVQYKDKADPFKGHELPQGGGRESSGEQRETYTTTELEQLHRAAQDAGNLPLADLILLGAYTGCRIEQLCQLRVEHIIKEDGITSFNFLKGKNKLSKRIVPVHPALKSVIKRLIKDSADGFLIPATTENRYQKRSHALSRLFGKLKEKLGFGPLYVFHSMRNTVITTLLRANVPDYIVQEIVGHANGSETHRTYSHGASAKQKLTAISKLPTLAVD